MDGCFTRAPYSASRRKRFTAIGSCASFGRRIFTAAVPRCGCSARYTVAVPPSPMYSARWYPATVRPTRLSGLMARPSYRISDPAASCGTPRRRSMLDVSRPPPLTFRPFAMGADPHGSAGDGIMRRLVFSAVFLGAALGCGNWKRVGTQAAPAPSDQLTALLNTAQFYQRLGRLAAGDPLPFVGNVAFAGAPADSVIAVLGLSLENRVLAFQREGNVFAARYRVTIPFQREGTRSVDLTREEVVRVPTFQETQRADESILFQQVLRMTPGAYKVTATV